MKSALTAPLKKIFSTILAVAMVATILVMPAFASGQTSVKGDSEITFAPGVLELKEVPEFYFFFDGTRFSPTRNRYVDQMSTASVQPGTDKLVIHDARGVNTGWTLRMRMLPITKNGSTTLAGSLLRVEQLEIGHNKSGEKLYTRAQANYIPGGNPVIIFTPSTGQVIRGGIWSIDNFRYKFSLTIKGRVGAAATVGDHTSQIEWTIADAP